MKEKLMKFAKSEFEYEMPTLLFSEETLEFHVEAGNTYQGKLTFKAHDDSMMKGLVFSSDYHFKIRESSFYAKEVILHYEYDATELKAGETHTGNIRIVSNFGEVKKTFMAKVDVPYCETKNGKIRDLFQFTNLAKDDWLSAVKLFKSEEFREKLLRNDKESMIIYDGLIESVSTSHALEEFLISVHKKVRTNIIVDRSFAEYQDVSEDQKDKLVIHKDNWGYLEIKVSTDAPFIELERKLIWDDNFIGDTFSLEYFIRKDKLKKGFNYGHIFITTPHQNYQVEIIAYKQNIKRENILSKKQATLTDMTQHYLNFRMARIDADTYISDMEQLQQSLYQHGMLDECYLIKAHLLIIQNRQEELEKVFDRLRVRMEDEERDQLVYRCAFQYLQAMNRRETKSIEEAKNYIQDIYEKNPENWRVFWCLLNVDENLMSNTEERYLALMRVIRDGSTSPMIYYEVATILKKHPYFIHELDRETLCVTTWMIKEKFFTEEVLDRFVFAAGKQKMFHPLIFRNLEAIYHMDEKTEVLQVIVGMLIRAQKIGAKYFTWYELGVKRQVRITHLYESYIYSMTEELEQKLPESVLIYFSMNCTLDERKKSFLYANILNNREEYGELYEMYIKDIKEFGLKEIKKHSINKNLSIIYEELLNNNDFEENIYEYLPAVMFKYEITCGNDNITGVVVRHSMINGENFIPLEGGMAQINIYSDNAEIFLVDKKNNRYYQTIDYSKKKIMDAVRFVGHCIEKIGYDGMFLLYIYEQMEAYRKFYQYEEKICNNILLFDEIESSVKTSCKVRLIDRYYKEGKLLELDQMLQELDITKLQENDRTRMIELCIVRNIDMDFEGLLKRYGFEKISGKRLYQYCSLAIRSEEDVDREFLATLCFSALQARKHSKETVAFLCDNYSGILEDLLFVWQSASQYQLDTCSLEDRIISQGLFTEVNNKKLLDVFLAYYERPERDKNLCRAYISYYCYKNIVFDRYLQDRFIELLKEYCKLEENELARLVLCRHLSAKKKLSKEEILFVEIQLNQFMQKNIMLPFFQDFHKQLMLPYQLANQYIIEYKTNPKKRVTIHYAILPADNKEEKVEYKEEVMTNCYYGIFTKPFVLFQGEKLQYYITEQQGEDTSITESISISHEKEFSSEENELNLLNLMLLAMEVKDSETLLSVMEQYMEMKYCIEEQFTIIE